MWVTIGEPGDPEDSPTLLWPKDRKELKVGTLTISSAMPQTGAECEKINYDPLVMSDGIAPTNDPVLLFRSPSLREAAARQINATGCIRNDDTHFQIQVATEAAFFTRGD
jgi:catalase